MINLEKASGLPIQMREDFTLVFENGLPSVTPTFREISSMRNYIKDPSATYYRRDVYHFYRDGGFPDDKEALHKMGLQYDLTVITPGKIGDAYAKTIGHFHPFQQGTQIRVGEVYEVISGKAIFVIQSASDDLERLGEV